MFDDKFTLAMSISPICVVRQLLRQGQKVPAANGRATTPSKFQSKIIGQKVPAANGRATTPPSSRPFVRELKVPAANGRATTLKPKEEKKH